VGFADVLKNIRKEKNITQEELAKVLNMKRTSISGYETGRKEPDFKTLSEIADYFDVSIDYLLGRSKIRYGHDELDEILKKDHELASFIHELATNYDIKTISKSLMKHKDLTKIKKILDILE
jgi:Predicted transcriptional regulators